MQKESLISIRVRTAAPAWLCIFHYVKLRVYKLLLKIKLRVLHKLGLPMLYFISLGLFFRLIPWNAGALWVHFPAWASKNHSRMCARWAPSSIRESACGLCEQSKSLLWGFIGFLCKPRNISLFSLLYSLNCKYFLYLCIYLYISLASLSTLRIPWIQPGLDPSSFHFREGEPGFSFWFRCFFNHSV